MKNSPQSPAGFNVVNFPSQLERRKEREENVTGPSCRDGVASKGGQWLRRLHTVLGFLKGGSRRVKGSQHPTHKWNVEPKVEEVLTFSTLSLGKPNSRSSRLM